MRTYTVVCREAPDWTAIEKAPIDCYPWGGNYRPRAYGQCAFVPGKGLAVRMTAWESNPKAVYTVVGDPVYKDSCLEFFASFDPQSQKYMNFEMNANGIYLASVRTNKADKRMVADLTASLPVVHAERNDGCWSVETLFTDAFIRDCFDGCTLTHGGAFRGNFYKCGDETEAPHYGCWSPIKNPTPSFHLPAYFGEFRIVGYKQN